MTFCSSLLRLSFPKIFFVTEYGNPPNTVKRIKDIKRRVGKIQSDFDIDTEMFINSYYSPLVEYWINGGDWEGLIEQAGTGEGDVVRSFKRTVDVLRQLTIVPNVSDTVIEAARAAIDAIQRPPVDLD